MWAWALVGFNDRRIYRCDMIGWASVFHLSRSMVHHESLHDFFPWRQDRFHRGLGWLAVREYKPSQKRPATQSGQAHYSLLTASCHSLFSLECSLLYHLSSLGYSLLYYHSSLPSEMAQQFLDHLFQPENRIKPELGQCCPIVSSLSIPQLPSCTPLPSIHMRYLCRASQN